MLRCLSQLRPSLKFVLIVVSLITLFSFAMNIGLALGQLDACDLTLEDAWMHILTLATWPQVSGSPMPATRL